MTKALQLGGQPPHEGAQILQLRSAAGRLAEQGSIQPGHQPHKVIGAIYRHLCHRFARQRRHKPWRARNSPFAQMRQCGILHLKLAGILVGVGDLEHIALIMGGQARVLVAFGVQQGDLAGDPELAGRKGLDFVGRERRRGGVKQWHVVLYWLICGTGGQVGQGHSSMSVSSLSRRMASHASIRRLVLSHVSSAILVTIASIRTRAPE